MLYLLKNDRYLVKHLSNLVKPTHSSSITASLLSYLMLNKKNKMQDSNPWNTLANFGYFNRVYNINLKYNESIVESTLIIDSKEYEDIEWIQCNDNEMKIVIDKNIFNYKYVINKNSFDLKDSNNNEYKYRIIPFTPIIPAFEPSNELKSKMTGQITELNCKIGSFVNKDDVIGYLESMKMKDALLAPKTGKISKILHGNGEIVEGGDVILIID